jgi:hypothetical protein
MERPTWRTTSATGLAATVALVIAWLRRRGADGGQEGGGQEGGGEGGGQDHGAGTGCCTPDVGAWSGQPAWASDGRLTNVASFVAFVVAEDPCWRFYPVTSALALVGTDPASQAPEQTVIVDSAPSAGSGEVDVTLTYEGVKDDSVAAMRYRLTFEDEAFSNGTAGAFKLVAGMREVRCQPGRGQQDWGTDLCL